jgi:WD40 repeat protein
VQLWWIPTYHTPSLTLHHREMIYTAAFNSNHTLIATGSGVSVFQGNNLIRIWDTDSGAPVAIVNDGITDFMQLAFSLDGTLLASANRDGTIRLWGVPAGK